MTLDALRCFCAIVETGGFRAAAERVHRSQPAVSQQLKSLERSAGQPLIDRRTGRPTALGQIVYERARAILRAEAMLAREIADADAAAARELRLGVSDTTALYILPPYVRRFAEALPQTRLVMVTRNSDAIADGVLRGELDLGLVTLPIRHPELEEEALFRQRLMLAMPAGHRLARRRSVGLADLHEDAVLLIDAHTRTGAMLRGAFRDAGFAPQTIMDSGSFAVIKRYIAEGLGISFLPECVLAPDDSEICAAAVPGLPETIIGAIWRKGAYLARAERVFLGLLRESTQKNPTNKTTSREPKRHPARQRRKSV